MPVRSLRLWSVAGLLVLGTTACGGTSALYGPGSPASARPSASSSATGSPSTSSSSSSSSASTATGPIAFAPCTDAKAPRGALCGIFNAPLDYANPAAGMIGMRVVKLPAKNAAQRVGSLLTNPGGPGGSGVDFVEEAGSSTFARLNQRFDIVGWDPRGIREPSGVSCETTAQLDALVATDPIPDDPAEKQALISTSQSLASSCDQKSHDLIRHVSTEEVVQDLDGLRAALGDAKLTYLGFSYGTEIGARYAARYPDHIRAMVLDGDVDPSVSMLDQVTQQADALEKSFTEFVNRCKASAGCPLGADPAGTIDKVLSDLDAHPVPTADGRKVGRGEALTAVLAAQYSTKEWVPIQTLFAQAANGNVGGLQLLSDLYTGRGNGGYDHMIEGGTSVSCLDNAVPTDIASYDARATEVQKRDPHFGSAAVYGLLPCAYWPVHGQAPKALDVQGAPPIVLVGATGDPATPYPWSQSLHNQIKGSVLLTREGFGHTSYDDSTCVQGLVDAYLVAVTVPADGSSCAA